ncbi:MAG TPA: galactokinase [Bryobacteraceae bacterium]|nr:galactokinase [Bryobacteraceae bacterium]
MRRFRAPGRVNLIGEHTDYNDGLVLPVAIDLETCVAVEPRADRTIELDSENFPRRVFSLDDSEDRAQGDWSDYARGVAVTLERSGYRLRGAHLKISSDLPIGSGLSSSAALEVAVAMALLAMAEISIRAASVARLCQRAENEFVGMNCGIMDQFACCCARAGHALLLDCRSLEYRLVAMPESARIVICDTKVRHQLTSGEYNRRRAECEQGVRAIGKVDASIRSLRDAKLELLEPAGLSEVILRRCRHVITEIARVADAIAALEAGDLERFGQLMRDSHRSLRDDYQVSCAELDRMVEIAEALPGVYGSRMTGAGFGGCTVSLVATEFVEEFARAMVERYAAATGIAPAMWVCRASAGASEMPL